jgi:geranylgeranyl diphosphate synthase type II
MDVITRIERSLETLIGSAQAPGCPPRLAAAMRHAVFPRGSRIRPRLCLAVAAACGERDPAVTDAAAAAIELMHCASLVHDDLPCFDNAATRRGRPSVQAAFGQPLAVLAGDALIVLAFQGLAVGAAHAPDRLAALVQIIAAAVGVPNGIAAGQAWESEPEADLAQYHQEKTGALFAAATAAGAVCAGGDPCAWRRVGALLGEAYQVADDLRDVGVAAEASAQGAVLGKPGGQDYALGRPNAALSLGVDHAIDNLRHLAAQAVRAVPDCPGEASIKAHILSEAQRLVPRDVAARAA